MRRLLEGQWAAMLTLNTNRPMAVKEKEDKATLQAEVQSLRQNNQRLQEESQSTVARLIKVTELLCNVNKPC